MTEAEALAALRGDDPALAARAEAILWRIWCESGDPELDRLLREGVEAMERRDLDRAIADAPCPGMPGDAPALLGELASANAALVDKGGDGDEAVATRP